MIVATTLCGPAHRHKLGGALESVAWADLRVVVDTSPAGDAEIEREALAHNADVVRWPWVNDFAKARNVALATADGVLPPGPRSCWALTCDSDERLDCPDPMALRRFLTQTDALVVEAQSSDAGYVKPRLIQVPSDVSWRGPAHEYLDAPSGRTVRTDLLSFRELPHSADELEAKWHRNLEALLPFVEADPRPRWHYYIGRAYYGLKRYAEALEHYERCATMPGWNEEAAYARFDGAAILTEHLGRHQEAVEWCGRGLARHAGVAELSWIAALASYRQGDYEQARCWAELALVHQRGSRAERARRGLRNIRGLTTGPADVLRHLDERAAVLRARVAAADLVPARRVAALLSPCGTPGSLGRLLSLGARTITLLDARAQANPRVVRNHYVAVDDPATGERLYRRRCERCDGLGNIEGFEPAGGCPDCGGSGVAAASPDVANGEAP